MTFPSLTGEQIWLGIGLLGQSLFFMRFFVQWLASERARKSIIPKAFWYFSLSGGITLLAYALYRQDPVFIIGQGTGLLIYLRNLYFITRKSSPDAPSGTAENPIKAS